MVSLGIGLLTLAAAAGAWSGRRALVAVTALSAAGLWAYQPLGGRPSFAIEPVLALVILAILAFRGYRLPRAWLWPAAIVFAVLLLPRLFPALPLLHDFLVPLAVLCTAIAWSAVDARPMVAVALWLAVSFAADEIELVTQSRPQAYLWPFAGPAVISVAVIIAGIWRVRRQAVL